MTRKGPRTTSSESTEREGDADVIPIATKKRERVSEDFSQRAFDVVRKATEAHDDDPE